jgi:hypothetical protein
MNCTPFNRHATTQSQPWIALVLVSLLALAFIVVGSARATSKVVPTNATLPVISGTVTEGQLLTTTPGTWDGTIPFTYAYQWQRCDATGAGCTNIAGAKAAAYSLQSADVGGVVRVEVTATNGHGANGVISAATAVVESDPSLPAPSVNPTPLSPDCAHLNIDKFVSTPTIISHDTKSVTAYFHVSACGGSVEGAAVYVSVVPSGLVAIPGVRVTNTDGWVTLKLKALRAFPVSTKQQQLLLMLVRATKPGNNVLSAASGRRLVGVHLAKG